LKRFKFLLKLKLLGLGYLVRLLAGNWISGPSNPETSLGWWRELRMRVSLWNCFIRPKLAGE
jgi:hypothetical protein